MKICQSPTKMFRIESTPRHLSAPRSRLTKYRQAVDCGFNGADSEFTGSPISGLPLDVVRRSFEELFYEQEIPEHQRVQLILNCLSGLTSEYFFSCIHNQLALNIWPLIYWSSVSILKSTIQKQYHTWNDLRSLVLSLKRMKRYRSAHSSSLSYQRVYHAVWPVLPRGKSRWSYFFLFS